MKMFAPLLYMLFLASCSNIAPAKSDEIDIMVYNVENLFDTKHDEGKNDWAYLPMHTEGKAKACKEITYRRYRKECEETNWTEEKLNLKLNQIKRVVTANGKLPTFLALSEIENQNVVQKLANVLGYKNLIVSNSPDKRGVDLALLYNESKSIKKLSQNELVLKGEYFNEKPTRNILEAQFLIKGKFKVAIFVNHWPSLGNPTSTRIIAANTLSQRIRELQKKDPKLHVLAVGDFNTIPSNYPHPFHTVLFKDQLLHDLDTLFYSDKNIPWSEKNKRPLGSYFYSRAMTWNKLDRIFLSTNLKDNKGLDVNITSYNILAPLFATKTFVYQRKSEFLYGSKINNVPRRYYHNATSAAKAGYSDHFPLVAKFKFE